jgi:hypothetical protein
MNIYADQQPVAVTQIPTKLHSHTEYSKMKFKDRAIEAGVVAAIATLFTRRIRTWHDIAHVYLFVGLAFYLCDEYVSTMSENFRSSIFAALAFGFFDAENFYARSTGGNLIQSAFNAT